MTYGFWARGNDVRPGTSDHSPGSGYHYVGYPMAYWVEFKPAYGFHQGAVWPIPHSTVAFGFTPMPPLSSSPWFVLEHRSTSLLPNLKIRPSGKAPHVLRTTPIPTRRRLTWFQMPFSLRPRDLFCRTNKIQRTAGDPAIF